MAEGLASLGINVSTLVAQVVNFSVLLLLLYLVAYKPLMRMFDERSRKVKESIEQTEQIKEQAAKADEETAKRIEEAGREGERIIKQATEAGEEVRAKAQQEAKEEARVLINEAQEEIKYERDEAVKELRKQVADLAIMAAGKVISRSMDKEEHLKVIDDILKEAPGLQNN